MLGKSRVLENSLVNQGWQKCVKCFALHNTKKNVCYSCSLNPDKPESKIKEHNMELKE